MSRDSESASAKYVLTNAASYVGGSRSRLKPMQAFGMMIESSSATICVKSMTVLRSLFDSSVTASLDPHILIARNRLDIQRFPEVI